MPVNPSTTRPLARGQTADDDIRPTAQETYVRSPTGRHLVPQDLGNEIEWALHVLDDLLGPNGAEDGAA